MRLKNTALWYTVLLQWENLSKKKTLSLSTDFLTISNSNVRTEITVQLLMLSDTLVRTHIPHLCAILDTSPCFRRFFYPDKLIQEFSMNHWDWFVYTFDSSKLNTLHRTNRAELFKFIEILQKKKKASFLGKLSYGKNIYYSALHCNKYST